MRTKLPALCILFFGVSVAFAQSSGPNLLAVTDYTKNTHGLKDRYGKQIWKSEFTSLEALQLKIDRKISKYFWVAEKNGFYGALNDSGAIVIPFQFEKLEMNQFSWFIAYRPGVIEVYTLSGEKKYTGTGLDEIEPVSSGFIITQNNQKGFLDLQFQERLPISFSGIKPAGLYQYIDSDESAPSTHLLDVSRGDQHGVYDLNREMVIPCKYKDVKIRWVDQYCKESEAVYMAFRNDTRFIFDHKGTLIDSIPPNQGLEFYLIPIDSCSSNAYLFAFVSVYGGHGKILKTRVINIQTGEKSKFYDVSTGNGNRILCKTGKKWLVLDEHFEELGHWSKWEASWLDQIAKDYSHVYHYVERRPTFSGNVRYNNQLVAIYSKRSEYIRLRGLYHYELEKYVQPEYFPIIELEFEGKPIYWAYKSSKEDQDYKPGSTYTHIDIYDHQLNKLGSLNKQELIHSQNSQNQDVSNKLFFQSSGKLYGAVNAIGEQVIPIKYKEYGTLHSGMGGEVFYLFGSGYYLGVFDHTGKELIPEKHLQYRGLETVFLATNPDGTYSVYRKNGDQLLNNVSTYFIARDRFPSEHCSYMKGDKSFSRNLIFFVQGEQLFYVQGEDFSLVDSETFEFGSAYLRLSTDIIIDQNGKVVDTQGLRLSTWSSECPMELENLPIQQ